MEASHTHTHIDVVRLLVGERVRGKKIEDSVEVPTHPHPVKPSISAEPTTPRQTRTAEQQYSYLENDQMRSRGRGERMGDVCSARSGFREGSRARKNNPHNSAERRVVNIETKRWNSRLGRFVLKSQSALRSVSRGLRNTHQEGCRTPPPQAVGQPRQR